MEFDRNGLVVNRLCRLIQATGTAEREAAVEIGGTPRDSSGPAVSSVQRLPGADQNYDWREAMVQLSLPGCGRPRRTWRRTRNGGAVLLLDSRTHTKFFPIPGYQISQSHPRAGKNGWKTRVVALMDEDRSGVLSGTRLRHPGPVDRCARSSCVRICLTCNGCCARSILNRSGIRNLVSRSGPYPAAGRWCRLKSVEGPFFP